MNDRLKWHEKEQKILHFSMNENYDLPKIGYLQELAKYIEDQVG